MDLPTKLPLDPDLQAQVDEARGKFTFDVVARFAQDRQCERNRIAALPRDARRRTKLRVALEESPAAADDLRHIHSVLTICALPYQRQPDTMRRFERRQGRMSLVIEAGELQSPDGQWVAQPLPYGTRARLLLLHLCSEAIRQNNPTINIDDSLTSFIKAMGFAVTGGKNGTLTAFKTQVNALAACSMRIGVWNGSHARTIRTAPFERIDVWFPTTPEQRTLWPSTITFSRSFFDTLKQHALPTNIRAVRVFANSPRKLDLLFWLGYRLKHIDKPLKIGWATLKEQFGQDIERERFFRAEFTRDIQHIADVFPGLVSQISDEGLTLLPTGASVLALPTMKGK